MEGGIKRTPHKRRKRGKRERERGEDGGRRGRDSQDSPFLQISVDYNEDIATTSHQVAALKDAFEAWKATNMTKKFLCIVYIYIYIYTQYNTTHMH